MCDLCSILWGGEINYVHSYQLHITMHASLTSELYGMANNTAHSKYKYTVTLSA